VNTKTLLDVPGNANQLVDFPATIPAALLEFSQVFVSASSEQWCQVPSFQQLADFCCHLKIVPFK